MAILKGHGTPNTRSIDDELFEINCLVDESKIFLDHIAIIENNAEKSKRKVVVIPNLRYGLFPVETIKEELDKLNVEVWYGIKVGSTENHDNAYSINPTLFNDKQLEEIIKEQPLLIVADGTTRIIPAEAEDFRRRYPDSYQGYLNQIIALNEAINNTLKTKENINYSKFGRTEEDLQIFRKDNLFQATVKEYEAKIDKLIKLGEIKKRDLKTYSFIMNNIGGLELSITKQEKEVNIIKPIKPEEISCKSPALIFYNVGLLPSQISDEVKEMHPDMMHQPAFFDDIEGKGWIVYSIDNYGIKLMKDAIIKKAKEQFNNRYNKPKENKRVNIFTNTQTSRRIIEDYA